MIYYYSSSNKKGSMIYMQEEQKQGKPISPRKRRSPYSSECVDSFPPEIMKEYEKEKKEKEAKKDEKT